MENYHEAVYTYNKKVEHENLSIRKFNHKVDKELAKEPLQRQEFIILTKFNEMIAHLNTWERNERIEEYNRCNRPVAKKDKIQTLKDPTQLIFSALLYDYNGQLRKQNERLNKLNIYIPGKLSYVEVHTGQLTNKKLNKESKASRINICQRTFRRHRKRLEEAGILIDYVFEGSARPVKMRINPKILSVTEGFSSAKKAPENKDGRTVLPDNKVSIRPDLNNIKIKANVKKHSEIRSSAAGLTSHKFSFYRNTQAQGVEKNEAGAAKSLTLSDFLQQKIEDPTDFIEKLAAHEFDQYTPLRAEILEKEVFAGTLDRDQFKELVLQDFFKTASKLYKGKTPFPGSWAKAYHTWNREKFITHTGNSSNKQVVFNRLPELRYRILGVKRYLKNHPDYNLLFPGEYFDTTRTSAKEGGFEYTEKMWKKHLHYLELKKTEKQKTVATAKKRKQRLTDRQKVDNHVKSYLKGRIVLDELFTKVDQIGNKALAQQLPEIIKKSKPKIST